MAIHLWLSFAWGCIRFELRTIPGKLVIGYKVVGFTQCPFCQNDLPSAVCLDKMIVQELQCFPYGHNWGLRLSKDLPTVVLHLITQTADHQWVLYESLFLLGSLRYCGEDSGAVVSTRNTWNYNYCLYYFMLNCGFKYLIYELVDC